jgi:acyl-CoA thioester hydrolase
MRIKIKLPDSFSFSTRIPVRITDVNYGGHVGNDTILSIIHEARMQFFQHFGLTEMNFGGTGTIMKDVAIVYQNELFYGDTVIVSVAAGEFSAAGFELFYKLEKEIKGNLLPVAAAKTGMVCFDYKKKKITAVPGEVKEKMLSYS